MKTACPFCGSENIDADWVDIGVGMQQCAPYTCADCNAQQMNPYHDNKDATEEEKRCGWWKARP